MDQNEKLIGIPSRGVPKIFSYEFEQQNASAKRIYESLIKGRNFALSLSIKDLYKLTMGSKWKKFERDKKYRLHILKRKLNNVINVTYSTKFCIVAIRGLSLIEKLEKLILELEKSYEIEKLKWIEFVNNLSVSNSFKIKIFELWKKIEIINPNLLLPITQHVKEDDKIAIILAWSLRSKFLEITLCENNTYEWFFCATRSSTIYNYGTDEIELSQIPDNFFEKIKKI